jgi:3-oxoacyl-[acyl-carrier-protein] synthase II
MVGVNRKHRVFVTGLGIVSPLGPDTASNNASLQAGKDAVGPVGTFDVSKTRCKTAAFVQDDWLEAAVPDSRNSRRLHRSSKMVILALREAFESARRPTPELMVVATTTGGMSFGESYYRKLLYTNSRKQIARWVANYMPQKAILDGQRLNGLRMPSQIIANACSSGSNAIGHGFELVRAGLHQCVIAGGYDPLCELVFVGFDSLQASTADRIRPFDRNRTGLVLGEGAAFLILESEESAAVRGVAALAEVVGYGASTDTYHLTQPHPSGIGARLAMERALLSAAMEPGTIDYVNAHGTATLFNDSTEGIAISDLFGNVPVSSTKSMMGHSLGAAGAIEAAFCVMALQNQYFPPNINFSEPDLSWKFEVVANASRPAKLRTAISNSFGFGGTNASVILRTV